MKGFDAPLPAAFERRLRDFPETPVVVSETRCCSAAEIDDLARRWAGRLDAAGVPQGGLVGLAADNGPGFLAALLAIRRTGAAALLLDPQSPTVARDRVLRSLGAGHTLSVPCAWPAATGAAQEPSPVAVARSPGDPDPVALPAATAVVKLTSGSTGSPRGIVTSGAALVADDAQLAAAMALEARERILATLPWSHSYALSSVVLPALTRPTTLVLPDAAHPLEPLRALSLVASREVTFLPTVPATLSAWSRHFGSADAGEALATVRLVISAGAPLTGPVAERFRAVFGRSAHTFYGASECGGVCFDRIGDAALRGSVGTPVDGVELTLEPEGTVTVVSAAVADGYLGAEPTAAPLALADGRFRSSDRGRWQGGELVLGGRVDGLVNVRGRKVDPREVEAVLARLPGVEESAVVGVAADSGDGGDRREAETVVRAVVACEPGRLAYRDVRDWCRRHLAAHKVPRSILLVRELPRTPRGKLDRAALRALTGDGG